LPAEKRIIAIIASENTINAVVVTALNSHIPDFLKSSPDRYSKEGSAAPDPKACLYRILVLIRKSTDLSFSASLIASFCIR